MERRLNGRGERVAKNATVDVQLSSIQGGEEKGKTKTEGRTREEEVLSGRRAAPT
jgi:hypothetical protein